MNKPCIIIVLIFIYTQGFGNGNPLLLKSNALSLTNSIQLPPKDTAKKTVKADTTKKTDDDDSTDDDDVRSYAMGLTYQSNQAYHGIHAPKKIPSIEPNFTYTAPSGFYTEVFDQYIIGGGAKYNVFAADPGWNIDLADNTTLNFNWSHYFLGAHPPELLATSDVSNAVETYIEQWVGETKGKFSIDYDIYKRTAKVKTPNDWVFAPHLEHDFNIKLGKKSSLSINPEASFDFGTRNASSHYAANSGADTLLSSAEKKLARVEQKELQTEEENQETSNTSFGTLDYTLILSFDFKIGHFEVEPALNDNITLYNTTGASNKPLGYLTLALLYTIEHHTNK